MSWIRVSVALSAERGEELLRELEMLGAVAATLRAAADTAEVFEPQPGTTPLWSDVEVEALFGLDADLHAVRGRLAALEVVPAEVEFVADADWQNVWRQHIERRTFAGRLALVGRDEQADASGLPTLHLDPGMAFGSGSHETTRLCLEWLAGRDLTDADVLDYGCGSGVLGIAAALLGARRVVAVDIDPQALEATRINAAHNGVADRVATLGVDGFRADRQYDVVVANILAGTLIELAPMIAASLRASGDLVLSGILEPQVGSVESAYPMQSFAPPRTESGWALLHGRPNNRGF